MRRNQSRPVVNITYLIRRLNSGAFPRPPKSSPAWRKAPVRDPSLLKPKSNAKKGAGKPKIDPKFVAEIASETRIGNRSRNRVREPDTADEALKAANRAQKPARETRQNRHWKMAYKAYPGFESQMPNFKPRSLGFWVLDCRSFGRSSIPLAGMVRSDGCVQGRWLQFCFKGGKMQ